MQTIMYLFLQSFYTYQLRLAILHFLYRTNALFSATSLKNCKVKKYLTCFTLSYEDMMPYVQFCFDKSFGQLMKLKKNRWNRSAVAQVWVKMKPSINFSSKVSKSICCESKSVFILIIMKITTIIVMIMIEFFKDSLSFHTIKRLLSSRNKSDDNW